MKNGRQNYNWEKIKLDYICDPSSSLKKIAAKYHIRLNTVEKRSKADNWYTEKREYQKSMSAKIRERVYASQADALEQELRATNQLSDILLEALQDKLQFNRYISRNASGETVEMIFSKLDTRAMLDITKTLKLLLEIKRSILEISNIEHKERMELAREKLQLDRERLGLEKDKIGMSSSDNTQHQIGIVVLPDIKDPDSDEAKEAERILEEWCS